MASETGQRVGDYEILNLLGSGGMGRVYKVRSTITNREEAMKILLPDFAAEPELAARFMAEIRTLAGLDHPNITQLRTAFQIQNQFVMVMEYVEGTTLDKLSTQLPLEQVLDYSTQVLAALSYAHSKGVTHRDIKPANIMITTHGVVKLMDFGIAKSTTDLNLTRPGTTMGSIYYMSPEQVRGGTVDGRTDIYSFGVTLYEMLTGRKPFQAETSYSVLNAQLNEAPTPPAQWNPALSPALNDIVLRAMAKDPAARFQTAEEFRNAIKALRELRPAQPAAAAAVAAAPAVAAAQGFSQTGPTAPLPAQPSLLNTTPPTMPINQGFTPVNVGAAPAPPPAKSNRPLWIALGALAAVIAVAAAFAVLPHFYAMYAGQKNGSSAGTTQSASNTPPAETTTPPATDTQPASQPTPTQPSGSQPVASTSASGTSLTPATTPTSSPRPAYTGGHTSSSPAPSQPLASSSGQAPQPAPYTAPPSAPSAPAGPSPEAIRRARDRFADLDARADTVRSGIEQLRRQQQAQGFDLRGDMVGALNRMNNNLREADRAINDGNLDVAHDYMERANAEMQKLEGFLGR
ncbi:MAG TPA: protein kinase [Terracidiphilus sp.]|nr:protein kinase [Terracidiphilus sp.]